MVIDLNTKEKSFYTHLAQLPGGISDRVYKTEKLVMKRIPAAGVTWTMGDSVSKPTTGRTRPHKVSFSEDFYIGVYEVTRGQMALVYRKQSMQLKKLVLQKLSLWATLATTHLLHLGHLQKQSQKLQVWMHLSMVIHTPQLKA